MDHDSWLTRQVNLPSPGLQVQGKINKSIHKLSLQSAEGSHDERINSILDVLSSQSLNSQTHLSSIFSWEPALEMVHSQARMMVR